MFWNDANLDAAIKLVGVRHDIFDSWVSNTSLHQPNDVDMLSHLVGKLRLCISRRHAKIFKPLAESNRVPLTVRVNDYRFAGIALGHR